MDTVILPAGPLEVHDEGPCDGPAVVLVHGFMVDARVWDPIVAPLVAAGLRVVRPTLPVGAHRVPLGTAPTPGAVAHLVADLVAHLGLHQVTLVGNDSGGAMCQMLVAQRPERIAGLVLTNCDTADNFPPFPFDLLFVRLSAFPRALHAALRVSNATGATRMLFSWLTSRGFDRALVDSWAQPYVTDRVIQAETDRFLQGADPAELRDAEAVLAARDLPVLLLWGSEDRFFRPAHARRLAGVLRDARVVEVPGAKTFVMHDAPERVATEVIGFAVGRVTGTPVPEAR